MLLTACGSESDPALTSDPAPPTTSAAAPVAPLPPPAAPATATVVEAGPALKTGETPKMALTPATVTRDTELKDKPFVDAKTLKRLPARTAVAITDRNGGWLKVTSGGQIGWVRLLHVSSQPISTGGGSAKELETAAKIATGRAGTGNVVSTTGIRGLNEQQLREAKANPEALKRLDSYAVNPDQAAANAREHKLERRQISYLPEPG